MTVNIRDILETDFASWNQLYQEYAEFYKVEQTQDMRDQVWNWLINDAYEVTAVVAEADGQLVGLAHFRQFYRPLAASTGGFLDDLYVKPISRGTGAADGLINAICDIGRDKGWTLLRWITADDNYRARTLYDKLATKTSWNTYDMALEKI